MIYVLDIKTWHFDSTWSNPTTPYQYIDLEYFIKTMFASDNIQVNTIKDGNDKVSIEFVDKLLTENKDIKIFACNLDCFEHKQSLMMYDEVICKKYPNVLFVFFYHELDMTLLLNSKTSNINNVIYVLNSFSTSDTNQLNKVFPYYLINSYLQENYSSMHNIFKGNALLRKHKKYNFLNGIHKPHRLAAYGLLKKHNLLEEGFFSYLDYPGFLKKEEHMQESAEWLNMSIDEFKTHLSTFEIPYLLETYEPTPQPGIFYIPFLTPHIYSWQSYISITSETNYIESSNVVSLSEKSFKAFAGFNIPLIYGQPSITDYLKNLGFDMFDDLFDNTVTNDKAATLKKLDKNLQVIKNMSLEELHKFYVKNYERVEQNFYTLTVRSKNAHLSQIKLKLKQMHNV
jgi:hypothetical protein